MKKLIIFQLLQLMICAATYAQNRPLVIAPFSESISMPSSRLMKSPIHPGIMIGTQTELKEGRHALLFLEFNLGYYFHKKFHHGVFLKTQAAYQLNLLKGLYINSLIGLGYLHTFSAVPEYKLQEGQYKRAKSFGRPSFMPSLSIGGGYDFKRHTQLPLEIFTRYELALQTPFAPKNDIPILPHTAFYIGIKYFPPASNK